MKRSGGRAGRPFAHVTITELEAYVRSHQRDRSELLVILAELGQRSTKRAATLKRLIERLFADELPRTTKAASPMFD